MKLEYIYLLKQFHLRCEYRYYHPVEWYERLRQINRLIETVKNNEESGATK